MILQNASFVLGSESGSNVDPFVIGQDDSTVGRIRAQVVVEDTSVLLETFDRTAKD
jgi:hypothetical protein